MPITNPHDCFHHHDHGRPTFDPVLHSMIGSIGPRGEQGEKGDPGDPGGFGTPTASVDSNVGVPYVVITASGDNSAKVFDFAFHNMRGVQGDQGEKGDPFKYEDFTDEQLSDLRSEIASFYYKKEEFVYHTSGSNTTVIDIPFSNYTDHDILFVDVEGLSLIEGSDYTISDDTIVLSSPIVHDDTAVNFRLLRAAAVTVLDYRELTFVESISNAEIDAIMEGSN